MKNTESQILSLLDQAYETIDDENHLDALLESASEYLFEDQKKAIIARNFPRFAELDPNLERHIARLQNLIETRVADENLGLSLGHHAQMIISIHGEILTANTAAKALMPDGKANFIEKLSIHHESLFALREVLKELAAGVQSLERIVNLKIDTEPAKTAFGYCRAMPIGDKTTGLHITLTTFDWSPALFKAVKIALDLSESENLVLQGILQGQTQKEIAKTRNRSTETIKSQARAILQKSGCAKMNDLIHLCTSIAYVAGLSAKAGNTSATTVEWKTPKQNMSMLDMPNGRKLAYFEYGDPKGRPILYAHGFFQGPFFLDSFKSGLLKEGLRLIAPSRPWFGYTSAPLKPEQYDETALNDALALIKALKIEENLIIAAHQAGSSHAFRLAAKCTDLAGMVLISAGIPITTEHLQHMSHDKRMIAASARHAPSLLGLISTAGLKTYRKRGVQAFLREHYAPKPIDKSIMDNPHANIKMCHGIYHFTEQGSKAFVHDGRSQMARWQADFDAVKCRQSWLMAKHCHIMGAHFVKDYIASISNHPVEIIEDAGFNILYQSPKIIIRKLKEATNW